MWTKPPGINRRPVVALCGLLLGFLPSGSWADDKVAGKELAILRDDEHVTVQQGGRLLLRYCCEGASNKPYVKELTSPAGVNILRDSPPDHKHHRGLMFAVRVNGVGFWDEAKGSGTQDHQQWRSLKVVPVRFGAGKESAEVEAAVLREHVVWKDKDRKPLLEEDRVLSVYADRPGQPRLLTWQATFTIPSGSGAVTLTGSAYYGLGTRFLQIMDSGGRLSNSAGGEDAAGTNAKQATWCAFSAEHAQGKPITFAMFDSPDNRRHPARWFTMNKPFAYLSATLGLDKEPLKLDPGQRLTLRYGVAIFEGVAKKQELEAAYARWQSLPAEVRTGTAPGLIGRYYAGQGQAIGEGRSLAAAAVRIDRCVAFDWSDGRPDDRLPAGPFKATWDGDLFVDLEGPYQFTTEAAGEARVWVADRQVTGPGALAGPVKLEYGFHPIRVEYQAPANKPQIKLMWQFKERPREVISLRHLTHSRAALAEVQTALSHEHGREVVEHYGCARCHHLTGLEKADKPGPPLNRLGDMGPEYLRRWLADPQSVRPGTSMPSFHKGQKAKVDDTDREAVVAFLRSLPLDKDTAKKLEAKNRYRQRSASVLPSGSFQGGRELFHKLGCIACHDPEDPSNTEPEESPSLVDIGAKWPRATLLRFLENPLLWHPHGRMPDFKLTEMEAADLAAYLATFRKMGDGKELPEPEAQQAKASKPTPELLAKGKNLIERHGCIACHDMEGVAQPQLLATPLDRYTLNLTARGCLSEGSPQLKASGPVPHFSLSEEDRAAVAEFLARRPQQASRVASQEIGDRLIHGGRQMCLHCHSRDGESEEHLGRATLRYLGKTTGQGTKALAMTPPDLSGVGGKLRPDWINRVLDGKAPSPRPWLSIRMPRFALADDQRQAMVARLVSADAVPAQTYTSLKVANDHAAAAALLGPKGFSCVNCHYLGKHRPPADTVGPDLAFASQRFTREWFLRWLEDPARIRPGTPMPALVQPVPNIAGGKLDVQKETIWKYLSTTPPSQMVLSTEAARLVAVPGPRPTIVQGRVLGPAPLNAPRSVAIGLPNGHSLLFDAGKLAWLGHWQGDFLRETGLHGARHHWVPAGQVRWKTERPLSPILFSDRTTGGWITPAAWRDRFGWFDEVSYEGRGVRLKYRLRSPDAALPFGKGEKGVVDAPSADPDDGPWIEVTEWLEPNPPGDSADGYTRRLQIRNLPAHYDAVIPVALEAAAKLTTLSDKLTLGEDNFTTLPVATAAVGGRTVVIRVTSPSAAWKQPVAVITQPVLQPFTDQPVKPGQRFEPVKHQGQTGPALLLPNGGGKNGLEVIMQIATVANGAAVAEGPPRRWLADQQPLPARPAWVSEPVKPGELSESTALSLPPGFRVQRLPLPQDFLVCALTFWKGRLVVGGYDGEIRIAIDTDGDGLPDRYRSFAGILDQINNLRVYDDDLYVTTPGGVFRIRDRDGDGLADSFATISSAWDWSGHAYDWTFGLVRDARGNLYAATTTPHERGNVPGLHMRGAVVKITPEGKTTQVGTGTRYNFGFAQNKAGRMYFNVNQGHWNITCGIHEVVEGAHYGFGEPDLSKVLPPVVRVPYPWCRALTGMDFAEKTPAFGPFQGQGFAADYNTRRVIRWTDYPVPKLPHPNPSPNGRGAMRQGTCYPFLDGIDAGPTEIIFGPDGALYVGFMSDASWYPERARGGIYKVTYTGPPPFAVHSGQVTKDGFAIELTEPADPASVKGIGCVRVHRYFHQYKGNYHSEEIAHEDVLTHRVELSADRRTLLVTTASHVTPRIYRVQLRDIRASDGRPLDRGEIYLTVHAVPK